MSSFGNFLLRHPILPFPLAAFPVLCQPTDRRVADHMEQCDPFYLFLHGWALDWIYACQALDLSQKSGIMSMSSVGIIFCLDYQDLFHRLELIA